MDLTEASNKPGGGYFYSAHMAVDLSRGYNPPVAFFVWIQEKEWKLEPEDISQNAG